MLVWMNSPIIHDLASAIVLTQSLHTFLTFRKPRSITPKTHWELNKTIITANCNICWRSWQLPNIVMASFKPSDTMLRKHGCDTSVTKQKHPLIIINNVHHNLYVYVSIMINTAWCQINKPTKTSTQQSQLQDQHIHQNSREPTEWLLQHFRWGVTRLKVALPDGWIL